MCFNESENRITLFSYQDNNNPTLPTRRIDDNGAITNFVYKTNGDLRSVEDTRGNVTTYRYAEDVDPAPLNPKHEHLLRKIERAEVTVNETMVTYQPTEFLYDANGNLEQIIDADNNAMEFERAADGLVTGITDRRGHKTELIYEGAAFDGSRRRLLEIKIPKGLSSSDGFRVTTYAYADADNPDNVTSVTDALGHTVTMVYDEADRVTQMTDARNKIYTSVYQDGALTEVRLPSNNGSGGAIRHTNFLYDLAGRVSEIKRDNGTGQETRVKYEYTEFSQIERLIRLQGTTENAYQFTYDALGRSLIVEDPLAGLTQTDWESACPGHTSISAREIIRTVEVDNLCRVFKVDASLPSQTSGPVLQESRQFEYDELGRLVKAAQTLLPSLYDKAITGLDPYGSDQEERLFEYDALDRLVKLRVRTDGNPAGINDKVYEYEYDPEGNVTKMTDPDGKVTRYEYYRDNLLYRVIIERPAQSDQIFTYTYDPAGRLDKIVYPTSTGIEAVFRDEADLTATGIGTGFDPNGNLRFLRYQKTNGDLIRRFEYSYDDSNNRQSMLDVTPTKAVLWEYGFDWLDRLVTVKRAEAVDVASLPASPLGPTALQRSYVFDESDNRTFFDDHVNDVTYYYKYKSIDDNGTTRYSDQLEEILIYENAAGHRTVGDFDSFESLEHDLDGNLTQRTITSTGEEISYQWTALDRLKRVESSANGRMQDARYDVNGLRKRKLDRNGNGSREYGVGISTTSSEPLTGSSAAPSITYISGHMIMGAEIDGEFVYHLGDALSTVRDVVDHTGTVIKSFEFDEYGNLLSSTGSAATSPKTWIGGLSVNDDRADSGMFNMGHRNYAAGVLGRFISRDPIGFSGSSLNLYAYPTNPVRFVDPTGLEKIAICAAGGQYSPSKENLEALKDNGNNEVTVYELNKWNVDMAIDLNDIVIIDSHGLVKGNTFLGFSDTVPSSGEDALPHVDVTIADVLRALNRNRNHKKLVFANACNSGLDKYASGHHRFNNLSKKQTYIGWSSSAAPNQIPYKFVKQLLTGDSPNTIKSDYESRGHVPGNMNSSTALIEMVIQGNRNVKY